jgi:glycosyltransferase involved in cell wall biosynthesis
MTGAGNPLVSIVITAYGYERYVAHCIESCLAQVAAPPFEVIVVDDGSPDATASIARRYEPNICLLSLTNGGVERASNCGVAAARGRFWVRVDADDALAPTYLSTLAPFLADESTAFWYSDYRVIDGKGSVQSQVNLPEFDPAEIRARGDFLATGTLYRTAAVAPFGPYNEEVRNCGLENYELMIQLLARGAKGRHVPATLFDYRVHSGNMSLVRREQIVGHGRKLAQRFGLAAYRTNANHPYKLVV